MTTERGEFSETNLYFCRLMVYSANRKWSRHAKAAECMNIEAKTCFSERVRHIYFCLLTTLSTLMLVEWEGREKGVVDHGFGT
jgi:hypothetical protein